MQYQFGEYIKLRRKDKWTQESLAESLGISAVTISRWERGVCLPASIDGVTEVIRIFGDDPSRTITTIRFYENLTEDLNALQVYDKVTLKKGNIIAAIPIAQYEIVNLCHNYNEQLAASIRHYDQAIFKSEINASEALFKDWAAMPSNLFYACQWTGNYAGHIVALRLKPKAFEQLCQGSKIDIDLVSHGIQSEFADADEDYCLYIYSFFAANTDIAETLMQIFIMDIVSSNGRCLAAGGFTCSSDGIAIANSYGAKPTYYKTAESSSAANLFIDNIPVDWACVRASSADIYKMLGLEKIAAIQRALIQNEANW